MKCITTMTVINKIFLIVLFILFSSEIFALQRMEYREEIVFEYPVVNVTMGDLEVLAGNERERFFGKKIKNAIVAGFLPVNRIQYIELNEELQQSPPQLRGETSRKIDYKILRENKIRFYLLGTVTIYKNELNLEVNIHNVEDESVIKLSSGYKNTTQLYQIIEGISKKITVNIIENSLSNDLVNVGLLCFKPEQGVDADSIVANFYSSDFPRSIYYNMETRGEIYVLPPEQIVADCDAEVEVKSVFEKFEKLDLLISGTFVPQEERKFVVTPWVYFKEINQGIDLFPIKGDRDNYEVFENKLSREIRNFIDGVTDSSGQFILRPVNLSPTSSDYWDEAIKFYNRGNYYLSEFMFKKIVEMDSTRYVAYYNIGLARENYNDYEPALEAYNNALAIKPDDQLTIGRKAYVSLLIGKFDEALSLYKSIQEVNPSYTNLHYYLGYSYFYKGNLKRAVEELEYSANQEKPYYDTYYLLGRCYRELGDIEKSLQAFKKGLDLNANDRDAEWYVADIYRQKGIDSYSEQNYKSAYNYFKISKSFYEDEYTYDYMRATLNRLSELEKADSLIQEGIRKKLLMENNIHFRQASDLRFIYFENAASPEKYLTSAISHLRKHLLFMPEDWEAYYMIGNSYATLGNIQEAFKYLELAYGKNPVNNTIILDLAEILIMTDRLDRVHPTLDKLVISGDGSDDEKSTKLVSNYLRIVADKLMGSSTSKAEEMLNESLARGGKVYNWSYQTFKKWIAQKRIGKQVRKDIIELTNKMEAHTESN